ncbi:lysophospholipid acyltransferase family protein [Paenibacillus sp. GCM10012307]|uniref:1-acyl-sn-glycerol-3-phosphate acyltransferase n=1 Tax=Paenibacillus roseus TaxID=2798579 RepID=A0A934JAK9_9BACL|nr:lysophospholipid acyltransferase family protein [Paenibacillus roseus]MBJ6363502.1 1-acyl-sn-glycerol-3-phosphate acyltransferase [Paenibacillus roseus]
MLYRFCRAALRVFFAIAFPLKTTGLDNIPDKGPVLLCSNHISNFDPVAVGIKLQRKVHYMAKAELFSFRPIGAFLSGLGAFPVKRGGVSKDAIKNSIQMLKDGSVMGIFPEGSRSNSGGAAKKGAAMIALRSGAVIIPVTLIGEYKWFRPMQVIYGKPVDLSEFTEDTSSDALERLTDKIMNKIWEQKRSA